MDNKVIFLKTDDSKIINENAIRWVKKMDECLHICLKTDGCEFKSGTHEICKINNLISYNKLNKHFNE
jgi:hypothetical protein